MIIQRKLWPHPDDGSILNWELYNGSLDEILQKKKKISRGMFNFGFFRHSDKRCVRDLKYVQLNPAIRMSTNVDYYRRVFIIANTRSKKK